MRYDAISADIRRTVDAWENGCLEEVERQDAAASDKAKARRKKLTAYSVRKAGELFDRWQTLDRYLLLKYVDGNVKSEHGTVLEYLDNPSPAHFVDNGTGKQIPDRIQFPGYNEAWKRAVAADNGEILKVVKTK